MSGSYRSEGKVKPGGMYITTVSRNLTQRPLEALEVGYILVTHTGSMMNGPEKLMPVERKAKTHSSPYATVLQPPVTDNRLVKIILVLVVNLMYRPLACSPHFLLSLSSVVQHFLHRDIPVMFHATSECLTLFLL
jgi:hypothetical protein